MSFNPLSIRPAEILCTDEFWQAWCNWIQHRIEIKKKLTPKATELQLKRLASWGHDRAIAAIEFSIANGWQGVFEPKAQKGDDDARRIGKSMELFNDRH